MGSGKGRARRSQTAAYNPESELHALMENDPFGGDFDAFLGAVEKITQSSKVTYDPNKWQAFAQSNADSSQTLAEHYLQGDEIKASEKVLKSLYADAVNVGAIGFSGEYDSDSFKVACVESTFQIQFSHPPLGKKHVYLKPLIDLQDLLGSEAVEEQVRGIFDSIQHAIYEAEHEDGYDGQHEYEQGAKRQRQQDLSAALRETAKVNF
jgi:hypothetical protein